jgi:hypothetical protein
MELPEPFLLARWMFINRSGNAHCRIIVYSFSLGSDTKNASLR